MSPIIEFIDIQKNQSVNEIIIGRQVAVKVSGLPPKSQVLLKCDNGVSESQVLFTSSDEGVLDLSKDAPLRGSYSGVDPDGIFWSRKLMPGKEPYSARSKFRCQVFKDGAQVAERPLTHLSTDPTFERKHFNLKDNGFVGYFVKPQGAGPFPTVVVVGGSEGGLSEFQSDYFALLGYASLNIAYHNYPGLPSTITQIPMEYFKTAIDYLKNDPHVIANKIGLFGVSRGGELAMVLASTYPAEFAAVISVEGSGLAWEGFEVGPHDRKSSWTVSGQDIPFIPYADVAPSKRTLLDGREVTEYSNVYLASMNDQATRAKAMVPVEKIQAPILSLAGMSDGIWPSYEISEVIEARRKEFGKNTSDIYLNFPDAGHTLGIPGYPTTDLAFYHPVAQELWFAGGTPEGNARAQRQGWDQVISFLETNLR